MDESDVNSEASSEGRFPLAHADATQTGYALGNSSRESVDQRWRSSIGVSPGGTPAAVIAAGSVFVSAGHLYSLDQSDGSMNWCVEPGTQAPTAPAVAGENVVVATRNVSDGAGGLQSFDASDGSRHWQNTDVGRAGSAPTVHEGMVYVPGTLRNPYVSAVDRSTGNTEWRTDVGSGDIASLAVSDDGVFVYTDADLQQLNPDDGSESWSVPTYDASAPPVISDDEVYAQRQAGSVTAWETSSGDRRWESDLLVEDGDLTAACVEGDHVFAALNGPDERALVSLRRSDGSLEWHQSATSLSSDATDDDAGPTVGECLLTDDTLYAGFDNGLLAVSRDDGSPRWHAPFRVRTEDDMVFSGYPGPPAAAGDSIFAFTGGGDLYAVAR